MFLNPERSARAVSERIRTHARTSVRTAVHPLLIALLSSCSLTGLETGPTFVRVENGTSWEMEELEVLVTPPIEVAVLRAGEATDYYTIEKAYRIASVRVRIEDVLHPLQVIDFVGESPLGAGRFTYRLELEGGPGSSISLTLVEDN